MTNIEGHEETIAPEAIGPYSYPLGKFARMFLGFASVAILVWCLVRAFNYTTKEVLPVSAALGLLISVLWVRGYPIVRAILMVSLAINVFTLSINYSDVIGEGAADASKAHLWILVASLSIASVFEIHHWSRLTPRSTLTKVAGWSLLLIPALFFIVAIPIYDAIVALGETDENVIKLRDPNWTLVNEISFRAARFTIFLLFTYCGACLGSFLNVVASSLPRGEAIGVRDSKCPQCHAKIERVDNLPIFSFVNLGGKCRSCEFAIPSRYLIVELVAAAIFGSLFVYELISGTTNVPLAKKYSHAGVLWIILYPKWQAISLYVYHVIFMSAILTFSLIEIDHQTLKRRFLLVVILAFLIPPALFQFLQPVPVTHHIATANWTLAPLIQQLIRLTAGGGAGLLLGWGALFLFQSKSPSMFVVSMFLSGIVLSWQGLLQAVLFFAAIVLVCRCIPKIWQDAKERPTMLLLGALMLHHPFWKLISKLW